MSLPTYRVTTVPTAPYVMADGSGGYKGFVVDILDKVASEVGFKYKMEAVKDGQHGMLDANSRWTGMLGQIVTGEADIAAGDLTITLERAKAVDFSKPFLSQSLRLLVKKPTMSQVDLAFLLQPFSSNLILCIVLAMLFVALTFVLINWLNPYEWKHVPEDRDQRRARHSFGLRDSFMFVITTLTFQGYREHPKSLAGRTLAVAWFMFAFLIMVAYIASVTVFMMAASNGGITPLPYDGIDDVANTENIQVGVVRGGSSFSAIRKSNIDVYKRLADYIEAGNTFVNSTQEGLTKVRASSGDFVMLMESEAARYFAESNCDVMMYGDAAFPTGLGFAVRKGSRLGQSINRAILQLREDGIITQLKKRWWNSGVCTPDDETTQGKLLHVAKQTNLRHVAAAFFLLLAGGMLAVLFLIGEIVFKKLRT